MISTKKNTTNHVQICKKWFLFQKKYEVSTFNFFLRSYIRSSEFGPCDNIFFEDWTQQSSIIFAVQAEC